MQPLPWLLLCGCCKDLRGRPFRSMGRERGSAGRLSPAQQPGARARWGCRRGRGAMRALQFPSPPPPVPTGLACLCLDAGRPVLSLPSPRSWRGDTAHQQPPPEVLRRSCPGRRRASQTLARVCRTLDTAELASPSAAGRLPAAPLAAAAAPWTAPRAAAPAAPAQRGPAPACRRAQAPGKFVNRPLACLALPCLGLACLALPCRAVPCLTSGLSAVALSAIFLRRRRQREECFMPINAELGRLFLGLSLGAPPTPGEPARRPPSPPLATQSQHAPCPAPPPLLSS